MRDPEPWTRERVDLRLVAAFRAMPSCPIFGLPTRLRTATGQRSPMTDVLEWAALVGNKLDRTYLLAWARCRATRNSYGAYCKGIGWKRSSAEAGRRRAAAAIAVSLNRQSGLGASNPPPGPVSGPTTSTSLDSGKEAPGPSACIETAAGHIGSTLAMA